MNELDEKRFVLEIQDLANQNDFDKAMTVLREVWMDGYLRGCNDLIEREGDD